MIEKTPGILSISGALTLTLSRRTGRGNNIHCRSTDNKYLPTNSRDQKGSH